MTDEEREQAQWIARRIPDIATELALAEQPAELVDHLDILLANGQLSTDTKRIIVQGISQLFEPEERLRLAVYLVLISPDYAILK